MQIKEEMEAWPHGNCVLYFKDFAFDPLFIWFNGHKLQTYK